MTIDHFRDFSRKIVSYLTNEIVRNGKNTQRINENHIGFYIIIVSRKKKRIFVKCAEL